MDHSIKVKEEIDIVDPSVRVIEVVQGICNSTIQEEPFYILDIRDIVQKYENWVKIFPRITPFYAVKCNYCRAVLNILATLGANFDCASAVEIDLILSIGVSPDRIIFANPVKYQSHIRHAKAMGVHLLIFDTEDELKKIKNLYPQAKLVLRFRCDAQKSLSAAFGAKFGCDPLEGPSLLKIAKRLDLKVTGISFHVTSGCFEPGAYSRALKYAKDLIDFSNSLGYNIELVDIGGGFPGQCNELFFEIGEVINKSIKDFFPNSPINFISEPGRYFMETAFSLVCMIHSKKTIKGDPIHQMYYINEGLFGAFASNVYDKHAEMPKILAAPQVCTKLYCSDIWGPTMTSMDSVLQNIWLPELQIGDYLIFENMGAYGIMWISNFNGFPTPQVKCICSEENWNLIKDVLLLKPNFQNQNGTCLLKVPLNYIIEDKKITKCSVRLKVLNDSC